MAALLVLKGFLPLIYLLERRTYTAVMNLLP